MTNPQQMRDDFRADNIVFRSLDDAAIDYVINNTINGGRYRIAWLMRNAILSFGVTFEQALNNLRICK